MASRLLHTGKISLCHKLHITPEGQIHKLFKNTINKMKRKQMFRNVDLFVGIDLQSFTNLFTQLLLLLLLY